VEACAHCGAPMVHLPNHNGARKFCSPPCRMKGTWQQQKRRQEAARIKIAPLPPPTGHCLYCNTPIPTGRARFCTARCGDRTYKERVAAALLVTSPPKPCTCAVCGKRWKVPHRNGVLPRFCSFCIGERRKQRNRADYLRRRDAQRAA
jgi:predicted nucleic acid-binding Zn ribbon protein